VTAICPQDNLPDVYTMTVEGNRCVTVEDIIAAVDAWKKKKAYQEVVTADLARRLGCTVTTVGWHSGVKTTVVVP
jgi:hypothetical protein